MLPQIFLIFLINALRLILRNSGVLVVSSKREIYTARFSFIWVMKERWEGVEQNRNFLVLCVHYILALYSFIYTR